jgi:hypothetical protein
MLIRDGMSNRVARVCETQWDAVMQGSEQSDETLSQLLRRFLQENEADEEHPK